MEYDAPAFFDLMSYARNAEHDVIDMVSGDPDWGSPEGIGEGLHEYADLGGADFQYPPTEGLAELREAVAARHGVDVNRVVVTVGGGEANYLAMALGLERWTGEEALLTDPVYPYYPGKVKMLGGSVRYVPADRDGRLDPGTVRERITDGTALVVANTPNNPTGAVYDERTMRELVAIAEEYDALLVSDEVYDRFDFSGRFTSALEFDSGNVAVTNSFSKTFAVTGFRVGYGVFPSPELADAARDRHMLTVTAGVRPSQHAVLHALRTTDREYHDRSRAVLEARVETFTDALDDAGAEYMSPGGAFYVMARFEGFPGTDENVRRLIDEAGVAGMPGSAFGESRADWLRFALVTPRAGEAADRLADYF
jgi:aspartate/methionine/tyrosine aminotransferase